MRLFERVDREGPNHAVVLGVFVDEALTFASGSGVSVDAVAVSRGPGSYTGLRIGVSMAKGLCYSRSIPLLAVDTLELLCVPVLLERDVEDDALLCPMIDARRMEVYAAIYDKSLQCQRAAGADIIDSESYREQLEKHPVYFFGPGAMKCKDVIQHPNAHFIPGILPLASNMLPLAEKVFREKKFEDTAYFTPFYLKDFKATVARDRLRI